MGVSGHSRIFFFLSLFEGAVKFNIFISQLIISILLVLLRMIGTISYCSWCSIRAGMKTAFPPAVSLVTCNFHSPPFYSPFYLITFLFCICTCLFFEKNYLLLGRGGFTCISHLQFLEQNTLSLPIDGLSPTSVKSFNRGIGKCIRLEQQRVYSSDSFPHGIT
jgi:hypothetical protein